MKEKTFAACYAAWKKEKSLYVKPSSLAAYDFLAIRHLLPRFGTSCNISEQQVQLFVREKLEEGLGHHSIRDILAVLRMVMAYGAHRNGTALPSWQIRLPAAQKRRDIQTLSSHEQRRLMGYLEKNPSLPNLGLLISLSTGMRIGEICGLRWDDINMKENIIHVRRTVSRIYNKVDRQSHVAIGTPKTINSMRDVPIALSLKTLLRDMTASARDNSYLLSNTPIPVEPATYRRHFMKTLARAGIRPLHFHALRHTFATRCIESHCDYKTLSSILGHSNISTTLNIYVHPTMEQKRHCITQMLEQLGKTKLE